MTSPDTGVSVLVLCGVSFLFLFGIAYSVGREDLKPGQLWSFFLGAIVVPLLSVFFGLGAAMEEAKKVGFCGTSCHVMHPYYEDLKNPTSTTLAAVHFQNRLILENQCYSCHTNYTIFGPFEAKVSGLKHVWNHYTEQVEQPIKLRGEYETSNCLYCHGEAKRYRDQHSELLVEIEQGEMSCLTCHGPFHPSQEERGGDG